MKLKLNSQKVKNLKRKLGLTWFDIAKMGGKKSKQAVYDYVLNERVSGAVFFAKVFRCKPKDLIK
jgi:hypothetical protein